MKLFYHMKIHFSLLNLTLNFFSDGTKRKHCHHSTLHILRFPCTSVTLKGLFKIVDESVKKKNKNKNNIHVYRVCNVSMSN